MAGVFIAWVKGLTRRREVIHMASALGISRREVASLCMEWWEWCDDEGEFDMSRNCHAKNVTRCFVNEHVGRDGFAEAMIEVGWIIEHDGKHLEMPRLGDWVGSSAKERLSAQLRQQRKRARHGNVTEMSRNECDKNVTREEKRRVNTSTNVEVTVQPKVARRPSSEFSFPLVTGSLWPLTVAKLDQYRATYADRLDVDAELRKARQWLFDHKDRRPRSNMAGFITRWLNRSYDKATPGNGKDRVTPLDPTRKPLYNAETGEIVYAKE